MVFNGTLTSNANPAVQVLQGVNELTGNLLGVSLLFLVFGIVYFANGGEPTKDTLTGALFITMIAALLLRYLSLIGDGVLGITVVLSIGSIVLLINRS